MELNRGYKFTEVGVVPNDWEIKTIENLENYVTSGSRGWAKYYSNDGFAFIRITNMVHGSIYLDLSDLRFVIIPENENEGKRTELQNNDILISITADVGIVSFINEAIPKPSFINQHIALVRITDHRVDNKFLCYFLSSKNAQKNFTSSTDSGAKAGMSLGAIGKIQIAFPPTLTEQTAIANALSDIDNLIERLEKLISKKKLIKQGAMQNLLKPQKGWVKKPIDKIFDFMNSASYSRADLTEDGYIAYVHYGDIHTKWDYFLDFDKHALPCIQESQINGFTLLKDGDIVMADASEDYTGISKCVEVRNLKGRKAIAGLHTFLLRDNSNEFVDGFKSYLLSSKFVKNQIDRLATGLKVFGISKNNIKTITLHIPPKDQQIEIADALSAMDAEIEALESKLDKYKKIKLGMMQQLLTGQIRLIESKAEVINEPLAKQKKESTGHNKQINEAVIISVLAHRYGNEKYPLSRFRYTKFLYLHHRHIEKIAEGFLKKAGGPYNPANRYKGPEGIAIKNKYVRISGGGFLASDNISQAQKYFKEWYGDDSLNWLDQFKFYKNDRLEVLTTVDMAMEDLRELTKPISVSNIKEVIASNKEWKPKLDKPYFNDIEIQKAIEESKRLFPEL